MYQTALASALAFAARLVSGCLFDVAAELSPDRMNVDVLTKKETAERSNPASVAIAPTESILTAKTSQIEGLCVAWVGGAEAVAKRG